MGRIANWWEGRKQRRAASRGTALVPHRGVGEQATLDALVSELRSIKPQDILPFRLSGKAQWSTWDAQAAITDGMKASSWAYNCIWKTAIAVSSIPWTVVRVYPNGDEEPDSDNGLRALLQEPNLAWSWETCTQFFVMHLLLTGNSVTNKIRVGGVPAELWPFNPALIAPIPSKTEFIAGYAFRLPERPRQNAKVVAPEDVIHLMLPDPENQRWGLSPMQAAGKAVDVDREAAKWQKVSLQNLMVPPLIFTTDRRYNKDEVAAAKEALREQYAGARYAREPFFLPLDAKIQQLAINPVEADFVKSREMNAEEIAAVFQVPAPVAGLLRKATYSNFETAERQWWEHTLIPFANAMIAGFNRQLSPEFDAGIAGARLEIRLDFSQVPALLTRFAQRVEIAKELWTMGYSRNECNQRMTLGMPETPDGDVRYVPSDMVPADAAQVEAAGARASLEESRVIARHSPSQLTQVEK